MIVFGGYSGGWPALNDVYELNLITNTWTKITTSGSEPVGRLDHTAIYYKGNMVVYGGGYYDGSRFNHPNDVFTLNLTTHTWTKPTTTRSNPKRPTRPARATV